MVDLIRPVPIASSEPPSTPDRPAVPAPATADLSQGLVRLAERPSVPTVVLAADSINALQRLTELVAQLRGEPDSPESITAEGLADYVQDEAQDALDALRATPASAVDPRICPAGLIDLKHLALWLLWGVARSRTEVMLLMEGVAAQVEQPDQTPQLGMLRLVALLDMQMAETPVAIDLATLQPAAAPLNPVSTVRLESLAIEATAANLCQQIAAEILAATPDLQPFLEARSAEVLLPWHRWQPGTLQLCLQLEFIPLQSLQPSAAMPQICLAEATWLQQYDAAILRQLIDQALSNRQQAIEALVTSAEPLTAMVQLAWNLADQFQGSRWRSRRLSPEMTLAALMRKLLWSISQGSHEVMQLLGGIPVKLLLPEADWIAGTLRFAVQLRVQMPAETWQLDVATGHIAEPQDWLPPDTAIQLQSMSGYESLLIQQLQDRVQEAIDWAVPEMALWKTGTSIDWLDASGEQWQSSTVQLETGFAFMPFRAGMG